LKNVIKIFFYNFIIKMSEYFALYCAYVRFIETFLFSGAIDGTHIRIDKPVDDPDSYINRKQYFSLHIQGTVNHQMKFMDVFIGYPGSVHDARVFKNSPIRYDLHELCRGELKK